MSLDLEIYSWVGVRFTSAHTEPFASVRHAHEWTVWVGWPPGELVNGLHRQETLREVLAPLEPDMNTELGAEATNEGVCAYVAARMAGCCAVVVRREAELLEARCFVDGRL